MRRMVISLSDDGVEMISDRSLGRLSVLVLDYPVAEEAPVVWRIPQGDGSEREAVAMHPDMEVDARRVAEIWEAVGPAI